MAEQDLKWIRSSEPEAAAHDLPFVGRERELAELRALYDRAVAEGMGHVALLTGPSGIGKSRLSSELIRRLRGQGVPVLEGACREGGIAYQPFVELAQAALGTLADHGIGGERLARAAETVAALRGHGGLFGHLRRPRRAASLSLVRDGSDGRIQFFERVRQLLVEVAGPRPPVIVIHDAQLADGATAQLLAFLVRTLAPAPGFAAEADFSGLFLVTSQQAQPSWVADTHVTELPLAGLDADGLRALLSSDRVVARFLEVSGGVPRQLEALLDPIPRAGGEVLSGLSRSAARLCKALALFGRPAGAALLERLSATLSAEDEETDDHAAHELASCTLLGRSVVGGELRLGFARTGDATAVVRGLADAERMTLHRAIGEALLLGLEASDDPATCAEHLLEGQAGERSIDVALAAGEALERSFAYERAIGLYRRAAHASTRPEVVAGIEERLADLLELVGDYAEALEVVVRLAERRPDAAALGRVGHLRLLGGDFAAARAALDEALAAAGADVAQKVQILADLAESYFLEGAHDEALVAGRTALELGADALNARRGMIAARNSLGKVYLEKGDFARAAALFDDNLRDAKATGALFECSRAHINLGIAALRRADYEAAESHYRAGLAAAREHGDLRHRALCLQNLGVLAQWRRDYTAALRHYQDAVDAFKRLGHRPWLAWVALDLGDLYLGLGDLDRAQAMVAFAERMTPDVATTSVILENLRGRIRLERGDIAGARDGLTVALDCARRIDNREELSLTLLHLARLELVAGEPDTALRHLADLPMPCSARTTAQLLAIRGEARLALDQFEPARADLVGAEGAFIDLGDDEGRLRVLLQAAQLAERTGDARAARQSRQLARDLDDRLRTRVPAELAARYGRDPLRLALRDRPPVIERPQPRLVPAPVPPTPRAVSRPDRFPKIVGRSLPIVHVLEMIERVAPHDSLVLIRGESGTGKELVAEAIHGHSPRHGRPFVKVNCGALVESLLLSELFGHERGAFTGALARKKGRFELADGGTLFLDEIGDITPQTQVALLRVLQTHEFERVGGTQPIRVDVRIVCATNRDLEAMVAAGQFREDLYYRLKGIEIDLPPLRARGEDIPDLVRHLLARVAEERQAPAKSATPAAMEALARYGWPGNIRELENVVRSVTLFADGAEIDVCDLAEYIGTRPAPSAVTASIPAPVAAAAPRGGADADVYAWAIQNGVSLRELKRRIELDCITQALAECGGNITRAADRLGMKRPRLSQLLKEHGLALARPNMEDKR